MKTKELIEAVKNERGSAFQNCRDCEYGTHNDEVIEKLKRLAEIEYKMEQGTLIELPCKVGDTIYIIRKCGIEEKEVRRFHIGRNGWYAIYYGTTLWDSVEGLGKTWFLTREEAEKRLKELQNG